ncbi:MAG: GDSL-type esterase/lipase family protein [Tannerella sp.]|jgi:lysophospholipase L1-like esterase|nr:GDSL-type esterase/lipase family protein [Tannerella sp.]
MMKRDWWKGKIRNLTIALGSLIFIFFIVSTGKIRAVKSAEADETASLPPLTDSVCCSLPFINDTLCVVHDPAKSLQPFINGLKELRAGKDTVINIIHLGDSHIQAGFLSGQTMRMLQTTFGNAGRGWIAPFKLSKANEPNDYFISSNIREWIVGRCIQSSPKCPWGIGGIGIQTSAPKIDFNLVIAPNNGAGYSFNKVLLYRDRNAMPMAPSPHYSDSILALSWGEGLCEDIAVDTFVTAGLLDTFKLTGIGLDKDIVKNNGSHNSLYYGFMLLNGFPGILYHSIGVNGARFVDYTNRNYIRQLALLKPSLLIVSLGTNESFGRQFGKEQFRSQVDAFIQLVKEELPETALLITTPAESYKRAYKNKKRYYVRNDNIAKVADALTSYTREKGIACWDLFSITGGNNSCKNWFEAGMFGRDRIHFSSKGYGEQGVLLYKALIRSCMDSETGNDIIMANTDMENLSAEDIIISGFADPDSEQDSFPDINDNSESFEDSFEDITETELESETESTEEILTNEKLTEEKLIKTGTEKRDAKRENNEKSPAENPVTEEMQSPERNVKINAATGEKTVAKEVQDVE